MTKKFWNRMFSSDPDQSENSKDTDLKIKKALSPYEAYLEEQKKEILRKEQEDLEEEKEVLSEKEILEKPLGEEEDGIVFTSNPQIFSEEETENTKEQTWLDRLGSGLSRSSKQITTNVNALFTKARLTQETLDNLEDILLTCDLGLATSSKIVKKLKDQRYNEAITEEEVREVMADEINKILDSLAKPLHIDLSKKPYVILFVGVNGTGKTTTIGKLAAKLKKSGLKVTLVAGDTFRAAAVEQLHVWGERVEVPVLSKKLGSDAASLVYEAYQQAKSSKQDILLIDTAGRLQNKTELMEECAKIVRVLKKHDSEAPHTVLQVLDATTGQNAINQVDVFRNFVGVNGLVMTKLDGTTRGGVLVAIAEKFKIPIYFIGVGEQIEDLETFSAKDFSKMIVGLR